MEIIESIDVLILIFMRTLFCVSVLPIVTEIKLQNNIKVGLSTIISLMVMYTIPMQSVVYNPTTVGFALVVMREILTGLILGYCVALFFNVYQFIGSLWSTQGGIGMSMLMDPINGNQVPTIGKFYYLGFCVIFIVSGGLHWFIRSTVDSFRYIPFGGADFNSSIVGILIEAVSVYFKVSFQLAAPILAVILIIDCGMGILAKTVPQMNMFVIGIPLKVIALFICMYVCSSLIGSYNVHIIDYIVELFNAIVQGMAL